MSKWANVTWAALVAVAIYSAVSATHLPRYLQSAHGQQRPLFLDFTIRILEGNQVSLKLGNLRRLL